MADKESTGNFFESEWSFCTIYMYLDVTWEEYVEHWLLGDTITVEESKIDGPNRWQWRDVCTWAIIHVHAWWPDRSRLLLHSNNCAKSRSTIFLCMVLWSRLAICCGPMCNVPHGKYFIFKLMNLMSLRSSYSPLHHGPLHVANWTCDSTCRPQQYADHHDLDFALLQNCDGI